jgi:hypothetical protein
MQTTELTPDERGRLRSYLTERFDLLELKNLAFDLGVSYDDLPHQTRGELARELLSLFERRGRVGCLLQYAVKRRRADSVLDILAKLPPCTPNKKIRMIFDEDLPAPSPKVLAALAEEMGTSLEDIEIIASARGSLHLLVGVWVRPGGGEGGWGGEFERPWVRGRDFSLLDEVSRTAWRVLSVYLPRGEAPEGLPAAFSWSQVRKTIRRNEEQMARAGDLPKPRAALWYHAAEILADVRRLDEALAAYDAAIKEEPDFSTAYLGRGLAKLLAGDLEGLSDFAKFASIARAREGRAREQRRDEIESQ